jgi:caffeoyl-CoA O-methyltransferase
VTDPYVRSHFLDSEVARYAAAHATPGDDVQRWVHAQTEARFPDAAVMQVGDDQSVLLEVLTRAMGVRLAVEVGTFTGSSALAIARGLAPGGRLICCDVSEEWTAIARQAWEKAGVADRVDLRIAPALDTLRAMPADAEIDLAFVDADKVGYEDYYAEIVPRLRSGGLLLADNTLQWGQVVDDSVTDRNVVAIRAFNDRVLADGRMQSVLLPFGDGVTVAQRR